MVYRLLLPTDTNAFMIEAPKFELDAYIANYRGGPSEGVMSYCGLMVLCR